MTDLSRFCVNVFRDGDAELECSGCFWSVDMDSDNNLGKLVALAEAHRCTVVVEGGGHGHELPRAGDVAGR